MREGDERTPLPISLGSATRYLFATRARIQCLTRHQSLNFSFFGLHEANLYNFFEMAIGDFSLNSELFLHTAKNQLFFG